MKIMDPSLKEKLWHQMREDLAKYVPATHSNSLLMCPACGRFLAQQDFTLEHLIPQQALADDPIPVKIQASANLRSGNLLLCKKPLKVGGRIVYPQGCNSWKGRSYDRCIREYLNGSAVSNSNKIVTMRHNIAIVCLAYLAMVREYGYQIALTASGNLLRRQFFEPNRFINGMPDRTQIILAAGPVDYKEGALSFWTDPFHFKMDQGFCVVTIKNIALALPLSRDPGIPIAQHLVIKPTRYILRPDFSTSFD